MILDSNSLNINHHSAQFLRTMVDSFTEDKSHITPVDFISSSRYIPGTVSPFPGYVDFSITPQWVEPLNNFDEDDPNRETIVCKGVQVAYTTNLENLIYRDVRYLKSVSGIYVTADLGLSEARMESNIIPMFAQSGCADVFVAADSANKRKQGIKKNILQWIGGGTLLPYGAQNANKARQQSVPHVYMDEVSGWPQTSRDGSDLVGLFRDRASSFWQSLGLVKIFIGGTPQLAGSCQITREYLRGDQRVYMAHCLKCGMEQEIRWRIHQKETGKVFGFKWELTADGELDLDTVRYECPNCANPHMEHDKMKLFCRENAYWQPTATAKEPYVKSYHMPAFLSGIGMQPWSKNVALWLEAWDVERNRVKDIGKLQRMYNNVFARAFEIPGTKITAEHVSAHRRMFYAKGQVPNHMVVNSCPSKILFLTCTVDVHLHDLFVCVIGWTKHMTNWVIEYHTIHDDSKDGTEVLDSPAWAELTRFITEKTWKATDGTEYYLAATGIDSQYNTAVVTEYCSQFDGGNVFPLMGKAIIGKRARIKEFDQFTTQLGTVGFNILIDHYKERIAPVLRREWSESTGIQEQYTFNAPMDITDKELKELTTEKRRAKTWPDGSVSYEWHRPHGAPNELWDLLVYGHALVEILAWVMCKDAGMKEIDWAMFWDEMERNLPFTV